MTPMAEQAQGGRDDRSGRAWRAWFLRIALPAAAVLLIVWLLPDRSLQRSTELPPVLRGAARVTVALEPIGAVERFPERFAWSADPLAQRYRFELYDAAARLRHTQVTSDTVTTVPPALQTEAAGGTPPWPGGAWRVVPIDAGGHELAAPPLQRFEVESAREGFGLPEAPEETPAH